MEIDSEIGLGKTRKTPAFKITRDGFAFLAMGFTGKTSKIVSGDDRLLKIEETVLLRTFQTGNSFVWISPKPRRYADHYAPLRHCSANITNPVTATPLMLSELQPG